MPRIPGMPPLDYGDVAPDDLLYIVDVSDLSDSSEGSGKHTTPVALRRAAVHFTKIQLASGVVAGTDDLPFDTGLAGFYGGGADLEVPVSGWYRVSWVIRAASSSTATDVPVQWGLYETTDMDYRARSLTDRAGNNTSRAVLTYFSDVVYLAVGEKYRMMSASSETQTVSSSALERSLTIEFIGHT